MKIVIIIEGDTEKIFLPYLRIFLETVLQGNMPKLQTNKHDGKIPTKDKLKRIVNNLLSGKDAADYVIALTDIYTGSNPPDFLNANDAKVKMKSWVGNEPRFFPHVAQYDFEAWLLPYWSTIQKLAGHNKTPPGINPESINHSKPPAYHLKELFDIGKCRDSYIKPRDAKRILEENKNNLMLSVSSCSELKAFINTIISCCGGETIP